MQMDLKSNRLVSKLTCSSPIVVVDWASSCQADVKWTCCCRGWTQSRWMVRVKAPTCHRASYDSGNMWKNSERRLARLPFALTSGPRTIVVAK